MAVFPTRVGMNRAGFHSAGSRQRIPHTRGDEPVFCGAVIKDGLVFPTRVGMNRIMA